MATSITSTTTMDTPTTATTTIIATTDTPTTAILTTGTPTTTMPIRGTTTTGTRITAQLPFVRTATILIIRMLAHPTGITPRAFSSTESLLALVRGITAITVAAIMGEAIMETATTEIATTAALGMHTVTAVLTGVITMAVPDPVIAIAETPEPATVMTTEETIARDTAKEGIAAGVDSVAADFVPTPATAAGRVEDMASHSTVADMAVDGQVEDIASRSMVADMAVDGQVEDIPSRSTVADMAVDGPTAEAIVAAHMAAVMKAMEEARMAAVTKAMADTGNPAA